jgi:hypothetical protein
MINKIDRGAEFFGGGLPSSFSRASRKVKRGLVKKKAGLRGQLGVYESAVMDYNEAAGQEVLIKGYDGWIPGYREPARNHK